MVAPKNNKFAAKEGETASERVGGRVKPTDAERWRAAAKARGLPLWTWAVQTLNKAAGRPNKSQK